MEDLLVLEERGWEALSAGGEAAGAFYRDVLADGAIMLFPGGLVVQGRDNILPTMGGPPWTSYRMTDQQVHALGPDAGVVTYRVVASREGQATYEALISTVYVRVADAWRLKLHQQTPV